ncbi:TfoX/Sxy family protein [Rubellimicrobium mesophilum]|nr:TfoX/Sxy family protein [Rubellimicrobium mesophilum]
MRDRDLEQRLRADLTTRDGITETTMFGSLAFLLRGNLLACASHEGLLARLGRGNEGWALALPGVTTPMSGTRSMKGWVRLPPGLAADPALRARVLDAATAFVASLPPK